VSVVSQNATLPVAFSATESADDSTAARVRASRDISMTSFKRKPADAAPSRRIC
jgi:hypothetical protein